MKMNQTWVGFYQAFLLGLDTVRALANTLDQQTTERAHLACDVIQKRPH